MITKDEILRALPGAKAYLQNADIDAINNNMHEQMMFRRNMMVVQDYFRLLRKENQMEKAKEFAFFLPSLVRILDFDHLLPSSTLHALFTAATFMYDKDMAYTLFSTYKLLPRWVTCLKGLISSYSIDTDDNRLANLFCMLERMAEYHIEIKESLVFEHKLLEIICPFLLNASMLPRTQNSGLSFLVSLLDNSNQKIRKAAFDHNIMALVNKYWDNDRRILRVLSFYPYELEPYCDIALLLERLFQFHQFTTKPLTYHCSLDSLITLGNLDVTGCYIRKLDSIEVFSMLELSVLNQLRPLYKAMLKAQLDSPNALVKGYLNKGGPEIYGDLSLILNLLHQLAKCSHWRWHLSVGLKEFIGLLINVSKIPVLTPAMRRHVEATLHLFTKETQDLTISTIKEAFGADFERYNRLYDNLNFLQFFQHTEKKAGRDRLLPKTSVELVKNYYLSMN